MTSEHQIMSNLESRIVEVFHSSILFNSRLKVKGLVAVTVDELATRFVDVDKIISHDNRGKVDVGPRNALQQWKKSQNYEQMLWQNQWLQQQQQPRMRGEMKFLQSAPQRLRMQQMPTRVRMSAPQLMQSPKMSNVRMQQPFVPQSVVRLKKIPSHLDASHSIVTTAFSATKSVSTHEIPAMEGAVIEDPGNQMNNLARSLGVAQLHSQTSLPTVANKNKRKTGNQHNLSVSSEGNSPSGRENGDSKEQWKKIPKQRGQKALTEHSEEAQEEEKEMKQMEENMNCGPPRPTIGNGESIGRLKKTAKLQKTRKDLKEHLEEWQEEEEMREVEENKNCKSLRPNVGNVDSKEPRKKISKVPGAQKTKKALVKHPEEKEDEEEHSEDLQEEKEMREVEEDKNCKSLRPKVGNVDSKEPWKKISKVPPAQNAKKAIVTVVKHPEEEEEEEEKDVENEYGKVEEKNGIPKRTRMQKGMTASMQTTTQDMEALAAELLTSTAAPRKRAKVN